VHRLEFMFIIPSVTTSLEIVINVIQLQNTVSRNIIKDPNTPIYKDNAANKYLIKMKNRLRLLN